jgi:hypothetical protein
LRGHARVLDSAVAIRGYPTEERDRLLRRSRDHHRTGSTRASPAIEHCRARGRRPTGGSATAGAVADDSAGDNARQPAKGGREDNEPNERGLACPENPAHFDRAGVCTASATSMMTRAASTNIHICTDRLGGASGAPAAAGFPRASVQTSALPSSFSSDIVGRRFRGAYDCHRWMVQRES